MLMVIFGAGASYDSAPSYPPGGVRGRMLKERLPLAEELFSDRPLFADTISQFPKCQPVIPLLRDLREGITVERVLEGLQADAEEYPERSRQLAAIRYYLQVMLWQCEAQWQSVVKGVTNYKTLLDQIERWRTREQQVCLVTFNYDRMLEAALPAVGLSIHTLTDYVSGENYKVIKLHGSIDWAREVNSPVDDLRYNGNTWEVVNGLIDRAADLDVSQRYRTVNQCPVWKSDGQVLFPALAIPVETKRGYECPEEHLDVLRKCVAKVTKLLVIGWRATEDHFLRLLVDNLAQGSLLVMVVAGGKDEAIAAAAQMQKAGIRGEFLATEGGFTDFIVRREGDSFLRA